MPETKQHLEIQGNRINEYFAAAIDADMKQGSALGVSGTPAAFVNGHLVSGAQPVDAFKKIVDAELAKGGKAKPVAKAK